MSSVSVCTLTWNRGLILTRTMETSFKNMGCEYNEFIWTDNGSEPSEYAIMEPFMDQFPRLIKVRFFQNTGMHRGFNTSMCLARSDYVVLIGPDTLMPDNWVKILKDHMDGIPDAGIVSIYNVPHAHVPERYRGSREPQMVHGFPVIKAMPFDHFIFRRSLLQKVGYWREDFGLYGWADVEWLERIEKALPTLGLSSYVIPHLVGNPGGTYGGLNQETPEYWEWKQNQSKMAHNHNVIQEARRQGLPYYSPF